MNKLRLKLDDLCVDTFSISPSARDEGGTVRGHEGGASSFEPCQSYADPCEVDYTDGCPPYTAAATCAGTCQASCYGSCYYTCYNTCWQSCAATCDPCYPIE